MTDLLNRDIDGRTTPEEHTRLEAILKVDPAIREQYLQLNTLVRQLGGARRAEPPASLKHSVMRSIARIPVPKRKLPSLYRFLGPFRQRRTPGLALAFAGGVVLGFAAFMLFTRIAIPPALNERDISGTFLFSKAESSLGPAIATRVEHGLVHGVITIKSGPQMSLVRLDLSGSNDLGVELVFDPTTHQLAAISPSEPGSITVSSEKGRIAFAGDAINNVGVLLTGNNASPAELHVRITAGKEVILDRPVRLAP